MKNPTTSPFQVFRIFALPRRAPHFSFQLFKFLLFPLALSLAPVAHAATVTLGAATTISGVTDVNTSGTLKYAYTWGTADTVNGVAFTATSSTTAAGSDITLANYATYNGTAYNSSSSPFNGLNSHYKNILVGSVYKGSAVSTGTVTLNGLTVGKVYLVQIWVNDPRVGSATRTETVTSSGGNTVTLNFNSTAAEGGSGQYVVGIFTADATTQAISVTSGTGNVDQINAIQVRDHGYVWNNTAAGTYSWSTAGNWSPSAPVGSTLATVSFFNDTTTALGNGTYTINSDPATLTLNGLFLEGLGASGDGGDGGQHRHHGKYLDFGRHDPHAKLGWAGGHPGIELYHPAEPDPESGSNDSRQWHRRLYVQREYHRFTCADKKRH